MKYTGIACVKNEADIVEAFVRHNLHFLDRLIVLDHGSTDATAEILHQLQQEGLALDIRQDHSLGKRQGDKMTALLREAAGAGADWIFLLDGDEFLRTPDGKRPVMPAEAPSMVKAAWQTYCAQKSDDPDETNPVLRIRNRLAVEPFHDCSLQDRRGLLKAVIHRDLALQPDLYVWQGNHEVTVGGKEIDFVFCPGWTLAHYSLRSPAQYASKLVIQCLQALSVSTVKTEQNTFYTRHLELLRSNYGEFCSQFYDFVPAYMDDPRYPAVKVPDPLPYAGGPLRYTVPLPEIASLLSNVIQYAETLARSHGQMVQRQPVPPETELVFQLGGGKAVRRSIGSLAPREVTLELEAIPAAAAGAITFRLEGPTGLAEFFSMRLEADDGTVQEWTGAPLILGLKIEGQAQPLHHHHHLVFIKGYAPVELRLDLPEVPARAAWKRLKIFLTYNTDPAHLGTRYFQTHPFSRQKTVEELELKIRRLVTLGGFLRFQFDSLLGLLRRRE
ncbi:MAG: glycosyltransferase family 2 protein [Candidatus Methylacidiphilales bacterium]|nr:glycosyltransferase family 2 protein [Candidatus Methylacidiphilales bacterium]